MAADEQHSKQRDRSRPVNGDRLRSTSLRQPLKHVGRSSNAPANPYATSRLLQDIYRAGGKVGGPPGRSAATGMQRRCGGAGERETSHGGGCWWSRGSGSVIEVLLNLQETCATSANVLEAKGGEEHGGSSPAGPIRLKQGTRRQGKASAAKRRSLRRLEAGRMLMETVGGVAGRWSPRRGRGVARGGHRGAVPPEDVAPAGGETRQASAAVKEDVGAGASLLEPERGGGGVAATSEGWRKVQRRWRRLRQSDAWERLGGATQGVEERLLVARRRQEMRSG